MHDDYNAGHALGDVGGGIGRALMQVMSFAEDRTIRRDNLARQGRIDTRADQRLAMDVDKYEREKVNEQRVLREQGESRAYDRLVREQGSVDAGWSGPRISEESTVGGELMYEATDAEYDPTQSLGYRNQVALGELQTDQAVGRATEMADAGLTPSGTRPNLQTMLTADGYSTFNPQGGVVAPLLGPDGERVMGRTPATLAPTEQERRAAMVYPRAQMGMARVAEIVKGYGGAPGLSQMFGSGLGRFGQDPEVQQFNAAAQAVVSAILRVESGAAISVAETQQMFEIMIPQPGNDPETAAMKLEVLQAQVDAMQRAAQLVPGGVPSPDAGVVDPAAEAAGAHRNPYRLTPIASGAGAELMRQQATPMDEIRNYQDTLRRR